MFFNATYLIYFLYPSVYPIKGPAISDVINQENALVEENQEQSGSFIVDKMKRTSPPYAETRRLRDIAPAALFVWLLGQKLRQEVCTNTVPSY